MRPSLEEDTEGLCILHSRLTDKDKDGAFTKAIKAKLKKNDYDFSGIFFPGDITSFTEQEFTKDVDFSDVTFAAKVSFSSSTFAGKVNFIGTTFSEETNLYAAEFSEIVDFSGAIFLKEADFSEAIFLRHVLLYRATFSQEADFSGVTFKETSDFYRVTFARDTTFVLVDFGQRSNFSNIRVEGHLEFDEINSRRKDRQEIIFIGNFNNISIFNNGRVRFRDLSLSRSSLNGTDLRQCEFFNVEWSQFRGRQAIYGEVLLHKKEVDWRWHLLKNAREKIFAPRNVAGEEPRRPEKTDYARVEESCRYLKLSYEKAGDFKRAGDFHYGEMEMHRRASKWRWVPIYWYNLFRILNGYGERPLRALLWLLVLLVGLSGLIFFIGGNSRDITIWERLGQSFIYLLDKVTFQRPDFPEWVKPPSFSFKLLSNLSLLLISGQAALFLLALRNRLGRRR